MNRMLKSVYYSCYAAAKKLTNKVLGKRPVVVLCYHRVSDEYQDSLSVGVDQFKRQMSLLKSQCDVVSLSELVKEKPGQSTKPLAVVTFDDGYLDNYKNAFPVLKDLDLPATFFICTGIIGTEKGLPHDLQKIGKVVPVMNWDQIKEMQKAGYEIGAHTVTHINCTAESLEQVKSELQSSKATIEEKLAVKEVAFAYPYGGKHDISERVINLVQDLGYYCCLSAYGGFNLEGIDPFNVERVAVDYRFPDSGFLARLQGYLLRSEGSIS